MARAEIVPADPQVQLTLTLAEAGVLYAVLGRLAGHGPHRAAADRIADTLGALGAVRAAADAASDGPQPLFDTDDDTLRFAR